MGHGRCCGHEVRRIVFPWKNVSVSFGVLGVPIWGLCGERWVGYASWYSGMEVMLVVSLPTLHSYRVYSSMHSWEDLERIAVSIRYTTHLKTPLLTFQYAGFSLVRHCQMVLDSSGGTQLRRRLCQPVIFEWFNHLFELNVGRRYNFFHLLGFWCLSPCSVCGYFAEIIFVFLWVMIFSGFFMLFQSLLILFILCMFLGIYW